MSDADKVERVIAWIRNQDCRCAPDVDPEYECMRCQAIGVLNDFEVQEETLKQAIRDREAYGRPEIAAVYGAAFTRRLYQSVRADDYVIDDANAAGRCAADLAIRALRREVE